MPVRTATMMRPWHVASLAIGVCLTAGCYDGEALVEHARSVALNTRLAEVDLGAFHTTLPRDPQSGLFTELDVHFFGTVPRYRVPAVEKQLKSDEYRLRHKTLAALRQSSPLELAEPSLSKLRARIEKVVNEILDEAPVRTIGISDLKLREL